MMKRRYSRSIAIRIAEFIHLWRDYPEARAQIEIQIAFLKRS